MKRTGKEDREREMGLVEGRQERALELWTGPRDWRNRKGGRDVEKERNGEPGRPGGGQSGAGEKYKKPKMIG